MISTNLQRLQASNEKININIANAYSKAEEKGAILPAVQNSENLADTIDSIEQGSSGWQPDPDWWDIDSILENDTEDYQGKVIALIGDEQDVTTIYGRNASKIVTSDGVTYTNIQTTSIQSTSYSHTWDKSKDKECGLGYKTRYIIWYYENNLNINMSPKFTENPLYVIIKNMLNITWGTSGTGPIFSGLYSIQAIKGINSSIKQNYIIFSQNCSLEYFEGFSLDETLNYYFNFNNVSFKKMPNMLQKQNIYFVYNGFQNVPKLTEIDEIRFSDGNTFNNLYSLVKVGKIYLPSDTRNFFYSTYNLVCVDEIIMNDKPTLTYAFFNSSYNLRKIRKITGYIKLSNMFNLTNCPVDYDTLIRIIDALYDYSDDTENAHNLTLGAINLKKLTDEELAIGQNKGWTIS